MICFLRSAASLSASTDFAVFPVSALGDRVEVVMGFEGVEGAGSGGGTGCCSASALEKKGSSGDSEIENWKGASGWNCCKPTFYGEDAKPQSRLAFSQ
jgi:hypothetical protein